MEVTASTLYEAVAAGLAAIRGHEWVAGVADGRNVKVSVADVRVEHEVKLADFTLLRRAGAMAGNEGAVAPGGDAAAKDSGDLRDGSGEVKGEARAEAHFCDDCVSRRLKAPPPD